MFATRTVFRNRKKRSVPPEVDPQQGEGQHGELREPVGPRGELGGAGLRRIEDSLQGELPERAHPAARSRSPSAPFSNARPMSRSAIPAPPGTGRRSRTRSRAGGRDRPSRAEVCAPPDGLHCRKATPALYGHGARRASAKTCSTRWAGGTACRSSAGGESRRGDERGVSHRPPRIRTGRARRSGTASPDVDDRRAALPERSSRARWAADCSRSTTATTDDGTPTAIERCLRRVRAEVEYSTTHGRRRDPTAGACRYTRHRRSSPISRHVGLPAKMPSPTGGDAGARYIAQRRVRGETRPFPRERPRQRRTSATRRCRHISTLLTLRRLGRAELRVPVGASGPEAVDGRAAAPRRRAAAQHRAQVVAARPRRHVWTAFPRRTTARACSRRRRAASRRRSRRPRRRRRGSASARPPPRGRPARSGSGSSSASTRDDLGGRQHVVQPPAVRVPTSMYSMKRTCARVR